MNEIVLPSWRDDLQDYPSRDASHHISIGGQRMHFIDTGRGPVMLMVHGNPTWSFYYRHLIRHFSGRFRTVAVDHIGCGLSDKPQRYDYCLDQHIENLAQLIVEKDLQDITLVVHDWGGPIGIGAGLRCLDRIQRLVVLNTAAFPPPYFPWRIRVCRTPLLGKLAVRGLNLFARSATWMATSQPGGLPRETSKGLLAPYDSWSNRVAIEQFVADIPTRPTQPTWQTLSDIESGLAELADLPIQLIWGMKDWCFRKECLDRFRGLWPSAQVLEIASAGHYVLEDAPETVAKTIDTFIARHG